MDLFTYLIFISLKMFALSPTINGSFVFKPVQKNNSSPDFKSIRDSKIPLSWTECEKFNRNVKYHDSQKKIKYDCNKFDRYKSSISAEIETSENKDNGIKNENTSDEFPEADLQDISMNPFANKTSIAGKEALGLKLKGDEYRDNVTHLNTTPKSDSLSITTGNTNETQDVEKRYDVENLNSKQIIEPTDTDKFNQAPIENEREIHFYNEEMKEDECNLIGLEDEDSGGYILNAKIGTPGQQIKLLIDTTSAFLILSEATQSKDLQRFRRNVSRTIIEEKEIVRDQIGHERWTGHVFTDLMSFPEIDYDDEFKTRIVILDNDNYKFIPAEYQGILGIAYPLMLESDPFSIVNTWIESIQKSVKDKEIAIMIELCGDSHNNKKVKRCGYFDILENHIDHYNESAHLESPLLVVKMDSEWIYKLMLYGVQIEDEKILTGSDSLKDTSIDTTSPDIKLPQDVLSTLISLLKMQTELPLDDDLFWYAGAPRCWKNMVQKFPNLEFMIEQGENKLIVLSIPGEAYVRKVRGANHSESCHKLALQSSDRGSVLGIPALEGTQVIFAKRSIAFAHAHCGKQSSLRGPISRDTDYIRSSWRRECIDKYYQMVIYVSCLVFVLFYLVVMYRWVACPGQVYLTGCR